MRFFECYAIGNYNSDATDPVSLHSRRLAGTLQPIRVTYNTTTVASTAAITAAQKAMLISTLLPDVQATLQSLLSLNPVQGNLFASRSCESAWSNGVCASYSSSLPSCGSGSPSITIPQAFVAAAYSSCTSSNNVRTVSYVWHIHTCMLLPDAHRTRLTLYVYLSFVQCMSGYSLVKYG